MKFVIVLSALICCAYAQSTKSATPIRDQLERRAAALDVRVKNEIKRLEAEKRGHLALLLQEEEKRLETLSNELKEVKVDDPIRLVILEDRLVRLEYSVEHETIILQREIATQEVLLFSAKLLRAYTTEEIKKLEATEGAQKQQAERAIAELKRSEQRLNEVAKELVEAKDQYSIERLEVELRAIEIRIAVELRALNFKPSTGTPAPATGTTRPVTAAPNGTTTARPTGTSGPITTAAPVTEVRKEKLIEKATQLEKRAEREIKALTAEGKTSEADVLTKEEANIKKLVTQLEATTDSDQKELKRIEQEVNQAEKKLQELIKEDRATTTKAAY